MSIVRLFAGIDDGDLGELETVGEKRQYEIGDTIFEEGATGTHVYCMVGGRVEISITLGETREQAPVHTSAEGSVFGEFVLFDRAKRTATARANNGTEIFALEVDALRQLFASTPVIVYKVMDNLC